MSCHLHTISARATLGVHRPTWPAAERFADHAVLFDVCGQRWRVADFRQGEAPRVYRCPPDVEATHRVFRWIGDGLLAVADLAETQPVLDYHGVATGRVSELSIALEHALDRTAGARERLAGG